MNRPTPAVRARLKLRIALGAVVVMLFNAPSRLDAQGLVQGVQQGAQAGNKAAGPVGGVLGGAIGGVVGVFTGVLGVGKSGQAPAASGTLARGALERRPQSRREFRSRVEIARAVKRASDGLAERTPRSEIGTAYRTRLQVTQYLVIRFREELLTQKRIRQLSKITAFHGGSSHVSAR